MEFLNEYISLLVVGICMCIGYMIKHWIPDEKVNKFIPTILGLLGLVINLWVNAWVVTPEAVMIGLLSGLASTGAHQAFTKFLEAFSGKTE